MKKTILFSIILLSSAVCFAQAKVLDGKQYQLKKNTIHHALVPIKDMGILSGVQTNDKPFTLEVFAGEDFASGTSKTIEIDEKGIRKQGTIKLSNESYLVYANKIKYFLFAGDVLYNIEEYNGDLPIKEYPQGLVQWKDQGILYFDQDILVIDPKKQQSRYIDIYDELINSSGEKISDVQVLGDSDEIILHVSSIGRINFNPLTKLIRYNLNTNESMVLDLTDIQFVLSGKVLVDGKKTYLAGSDITKTPSIDAFYFIVFDGTNRTSSSRSTIDSLRNEQPGSKGKMRLKEERSYARTYEPFLTEDKEVIVIHDMFEEGILANGTYSQRLEHNHFEYGYRCTSSIICKYDLNGSLLWSGQIPMMPNEFISFFDADVHYYELISNERLIGRHPGYFHFYTSAVDLTNGDVDFTTSQMPIVDTENEQLNTDAKIGWKVPMSVQKLAENRYVYYGVKATKPKDKKFGFKLMYMIQIIDLTKDAKDNP